MRLVALLEHPGWWDRTLDIFSTERKLLPWFYCILAQLITSPPESIFCRSIFSFSLVNHKLVQNKFQNYMHIVDDHLPIELLKQSLAESNQNINWKCNACNQVLPLKKLAPHLSGKRACARRTAKIYCPVITCNHHADKPFKFIKEGLTQEYITY